MLTHLLVSLSLLLSCNAVRSAAAQTTAKDLTYTTDTAGDHRGDLYLPPGTGPFPAIVYLHGGSWRSGNKSSFSRLAADLARDGYAGFSIDYDLKAHSFPLPWEEARAAILFLRAHATEYHIDPARIVIAGTSAGGQLAALVALAPDGPATDTPAPVPVSGAIILNGLFNLCIPVHVVERYLGDTCKSQPARYEDASPLHHVHPGAPPFFVGHGTGDHVVPYAAADQFITALKDKQVPVTVFTADGGPHMYWEKKPFYQQNLQKIESFLSTTLKTPTGN